MQQQELAKSHKKKKKEKEASKANEKLNIKLEELAYK